MKKQIPLRDLPKKLKIARILDDSVLEAYNESVLSSFNSYRAEKTLLKFEKGNGELIGSNLFMPVHLQNAGLLPQETSLIIRKDLEKAVSKDFWFVEGKYVYFGLVLKTAGDSYAFNDASAKALAKQLKKRAIRLGSGLLIPFSALTLKESADSEYGLAFNLKDDVNAKEVIQPLNDYKWNPYTRDIRLAGACLDRYGNWDCAYPCLADSDESGRIIVISKYSSKDVLDKGIELSC